MPMGALDRPSADVLLAAAGAMSTKESDTRDARGDPSKSWVPGQRFQQRPPSLPPSWQQYSAPTAPETDGLPPIGLGCLGPAGQRLPGTLTGVFSSFVEVPKVVRQPGPRDNSVFGRGRRKRGCSRPSPRGMAASWHAHQEEPNRSTALPGAVASGPSFDTTNSLSGSTSTTRTEASTCADSAHIVGNEAQTPAGGAVSTGLWEAVEELRHEKSDLEARVRAAESRKKELEDELLLLRKPIAEDCCGSVPVATTATSTGDPHHKDSSVVDVPIAAMIVGACGGNEEASRTGEAYTALCAQNVALQKERDSLLERLEVASLATSRELAEHEAGREAARAETETLRCEKKSLLERLEVFERALELEDPKAADEAGQIVDCVDGAPVKTGLTEKLERLHSQFVLEVVGLRREVAGLKKKKWVLRSVLATGGANEQRAIDNEIMELRRSAATRRGDGFDCGGVAEEVGSATAGGVTR